MNRDRRHCNARLDSRKNRRRLPESSWSGKCKDAPREEWSLETLKKSENLFLPYDSLQTPSGLLSAITQLTRHGLLFVTSVPNDRTSNEDCEVRKLGERFGELRRTFYGETWDVKNIRNSRNIAYTNVDLGLHMDLLYAHAPLFLNWD